MWQVLTRGRLQDLVREVDPNEQLDEEVEELLLQIADDFIESTVNASCLLAKHRQASSLDVTDVQMHLGNLELVWHMFIRLILITRFKFRTTMEYVDTWLWNGRATTIQTGSRYRSTQTEDGINT